MIACENEKSCIGLAVIREAISNLKEILDSFRVELKDLSSENLKRHEEIRDCFYLSESTFKKLEESIDVFNKRIDALGAKIVKYDDDDYSEYLSVRAEIDKLRERVAEIEDNNESKLMLVLKMCVPYIFGILSAVGIYKWPMR